MGLVMSVGFVAVINDGGLCFLVVVMVLVLGTVIILGGAVIRLTAPLPAIHFTWLILIRTAVGVRVVEVAVVDRVVVCRGAVKPLTALIVLLMVMTVVDGVVVRVVIVMMCSGYIARAEIARSGMVVTAILGCGIQPTFVVVSNELCTLHRLPYMVVALVTAILGWRILLTLVVVINELCIPSSMVVKMHCPSLMALVVVVRGGMGVGVQFLLTVVVLRLLVVHGASVMDILLPMLGVVVAWVVPTSLESISMSFILNRRILRLATTVRVIVRLHHCVLGNIRF